MKTPSFIVLYIFIALNGIAQVRNINKLTLETTYSYVEIQKPLRDIVDKADKPSYFDDDFFNNSLESVLLDKQFNEKEKVQLFYLMQKKLGFAFVGVNYIPPKQNYFQLFSGKVITWQKTQARLKKLEYKAEGFIELADSMWQHDAILASNALLLATLVNPDAVHLKLQHYSNSTVIFLAKNPDIFNHYVCLSAALVQDSVIIAHLVENIMSLKTEFLIEDAICALYSKNNSVSTIKDYILKEKNPKNDLAIQTALCALWAKVPPATFKKSVKSFADETKDKWKQELCKDIANDKIPFYYRISQGKEIITKMSEGVTLSLYTDGALISNGDILEFDPS